MKRLFFGLEIHAPWPEILPEGRVIAQKNRHLTLAFLGECEFEKLEPHLQKIPLPKFKVGIVGQFEQPIFLPPHHPHVAAWEIVWHEKKDLLEEYYNALHAFLESIGCHTKKHANFLPHVTIARAPFHIKEWKQVFKPLPLKTGSLHLYESLGHSEYVSLWEKSVTPPFEEIEHTADIGYIVHGENFNSLFTHALSALSFNFPPLLKYIQARECASIEEVVMHLNEIVTVADGDIGCPFKAVSFHGTLHQDELYHWEMIIDV